MLRRDPDRGVTGVAAERDQGLNISLPGVGTYSGGSVFEDCLLLAVPMVMELKKVTRGLEMTGAGVEPRSRTKMARRRRLDRVSTSLARILVKNVWDGILVLLVIVIRSSMTNLVIFAKVKVKSFIIQRTSVGSQRADT